MEIGDHIVWTNKHGDSCPGVILDLRIQGKAVRGIRREGVQAKIRVSDPTQDNDRIVWVSARNLLKE